MGYQALVRFTTKVVSGIVVILKFRLYLDNSGSVVSLDGTQPMPASSQWKMIVTQRVVTGTGLTLHISF